MSREAMKMALEALEKAEEVIEDEYGGTVAFARLSCVPAITALKQALAELRTEDTLRRENEWLKDDLHDAARLALSEYERGFVDGMSEQAKRSVDKAVNRMAEPEQNPFGDDAERYARKLHEEREAYKALFTERKPQTTHWEGCEAVHPECKEKNT